MADRSGAVTFKGNPVTLEGDEVKPGQKAPEFTLVGIDMQPKSLKDYAGKVKVISAVPSLDTAVCDTETRRFNQEAAKLGDDAVILTVSLDLPMAQKRWCGAAGIDKVVTLSDFKTHEFGRKYGVRIKELGLLARCVFIVGKDDLVKDVILVKEVAEEPDYDKVIAAAKRAG
jgi:thiol peroxidase